MEVVLVLFFAVVVPLVILGLYKQFKLRKLLRESKADIPEEHLYYISGVIPFTKKESLAQSYKAGRFDGLAPDIKAKVRSMIFWSRIYSAFIFALFTIGALFFLTVIYYMNK